jgi:hypothetical protein
MGSKPGRVYANWSTPQGWLMKCLIHIYWKQGFRSKDLMADCIYRHVSKETLAQIVGSKVTNQAIRERGDKGTRAENAFEHPDKHPMGLRYMAAAEKIVGERLLMSFEDVMAIVGQQVPVSESAEPMPVPEVPPSVVPDNVSLERAGLMYFVGQAGNEQCAFGITTKEKVDGRINIKDLDREMKRRFVDLHLGSERYDIPPGDIFRMARKVCDKMQIPYYVVKGGA